jgi:tRNA (cmo5U34)-methyltransferase
MASNDNKSAHSSSEYDAGVRNTIPYYDNFHDEALNVIKAAGMEIGTWLDTGCGTGTFVKKAFGSFPGARFILADPSAEMMEQAKAKLDGIRGAFRFLPPVATQDLRINDKADVITAVQAHHYLEPRIREDATRVCYGMLERDGMFVTFENIKPMSELGVKIGLENWKRFQMTQGKTEEQAQKHTERFGKEYFPLTIEEHIKLYRNCGFKAVEIFWASYMQAGFYCIK